MELGFLFAAATIFLFGSWAVPANKINAKPTVQAFWLTIGHLLLSLVIFIFTFNASEQFSLNDFIFPFMAGMLWAFGITAGYRAIKELGITRALGIWVPIVIITSAAWGLFYFNEINSLNSIQIFQIIFSILLLIVASLLIIFFTHKDDKIGSLKVGILMAITLGLFHGSFFVPLEESSAPVNIIFLPLSIGMVFTMSFILLLQKTNPLHTKISIGRMMLAGIILGGGNYMALLTITYLGVSQGYPLTQMGIIVNTLWGVFYFKEVSKKRSKMLIALGILIALIGAILLNQARL